MFIIGGAVASTYLAKATPQPLKSSSRISSGQPPPNTSSTQGATQTSSQTIATLQLGNSSSETSAQSSTSGGKGGSGVLSIYLTDAPVSGPTLKYLLVNVSSLEVAYPGNVATGTSSSGTPPVSVYFLAVPPNVGMNVNLSSLQGQSLPLGGAMLPAGNISSIVLDIAGAKGFYTDGSTNQIPVVSNGDLTVPIQFGLQPNGSTDLTIDLTPNTADISQGVVLTPVIHAIAVEMGLDGMTTVTVTTTESLPPSTSTVTTTQTITAPTETSTLTSPTTTTQTVTAPVVTITLTSPTTQTVTTTTGIVVTATVISPPTTTQTVTSTTTSTSIATSTATSTSTSTTTVTSPTTTTQTVTSTTTIPSTTKTSTTTVTSPTTTTTTQTVISTTTIPPTTTTSTATKTSTTTVTSPTTTTQTVTSTATVTSTTTTTVTTTRPPRDDSAATAGPGAALTFAGVAAASSTVLALALGTFLIAGVTVLRLQRARRGSIRGLRRWNLPNH
jgi:hypothetical protein